MNTRLPARRHRRSRQPDLELTILRGLAEVLVDVADRNADAAPYVVRVVWPAQPSDGCFASQLDVTLLAVPDDPVSGLLGFVAPEEWAACGVLAPGHAVTLEGGGSGADVGFAHLVDRSGRFSSALRTRPGAPVAVSSGRSALASRVDDVCRRALQLRDCAFVDIAGDAPHGNVARPHRDAPDPRRHRRLARNCRTASGARVPPQRRSRPDPSSARRRGPAGDRVPVVGGRPHRRGDGDDGSFGVAPALIAWMDDGMFARWALECFPDVGALLDIVDSLAPPTVAAAVRSVTSRPPPTGSSA